MAISIDVNRPRNVDWKRAAAILYGDWGTSKAYVLGLAFGVAAFSSLPIILAVCALTGLVGINYIVICRHFPDGGGVYSAARAQGRLLAVIGALLLVADLTVTAALSGESGLDYFHIEFLKAHPNMIVPATILALVVIGWLNWFGPKHSGGLAVLLSAPTMVLVVVLIAVSLPYLTTVHLTHKVAGAWTMWKDFVGAILALSGVEAIANMTGVLKLDPGSTPEKPAVGREAAKAIWLIGTEVVVGTALLGWAMLSMPLDEGLMKDREPDMLRLVGEYFGNLSGTHWFGVAAGAWFGQALGWVVGILFFLLLVSAANTAAVAMIGVFYMMARDGEMPRQFCKLNRHGVPYIPLIIAIVLPSIVLVVCMGNFEALAGLYAIGVVGAIALNLGSCTFNPALHLARWERALFGCTFVILTAVEVTLAKEKPDALLFVLGILILGLGLRAYAQKRQGLQTLTVTREVAEMVSPEAINRLRPRLVEGQRIMVAARGPTPVLRFALDEAKLRKAQLLVLYVKEIAVFMTGTAPTASRGKWQDDPQAATIMGLVLKLGEEVGVDVLPVYAVSADAAATILDLAAVLGVDYLMLGADQRMTMSKLLKGSVVASVAAGLPEDIQLIIHG
ncbi:MAG TPA: universal stress protein [Chthoniobacteraceae bacterium]|jgi:amino acid transporter/nucleotide-binding universal stress UspA family protein